MTSFYEPPTLKCLGRLTYMVLFATQMAIAFVSLIVGMFSAGEPLFVQLLMTFGALGLFLLALVQFGIALAGDVYRGAFIVSTCLTALCGGTFIAMNI